MFSVIVCFVFFKLENALRVGRDSTVIFLVLHVFFWFSVRFSCLYDPQLSRLSCNFPTLPNAFNVYAVIVAESIAEIFNKLLLFSFWPCPNEKLFSIISAMHYK